MGMNTADIRNTDEDQALFWVTALPLTIGVLAIALVYGYHGDAIPESISGALESWRAKGAQRQRQITGAAAAGGMTGGGSGGGVAFVAEKGGATANAQAGEKRGPSAATRRWLAEVVQNPRLRRKKKVDGPLLGRNTEHSLA
jgi:hypothetical protein